MADNDNTTSAYLGCAPDFSSESNIASLISAPLIAVSVSNAEMAKGQSRFILENCFNRVLRTNALGKEGESDYVLATYKYEPIMITMVLSKGIVDGTKNPEDADYIKITSMNFTVPFLCIIPLSSLAVDKATIDFNMEITSTDNYESSKGILKNQTSLKGRISTNTENTSSKDKKSQYKRPASNSLKVHVNTSPIPLSLGVLAILDMYTKAIQPITSDK